MFISFLRDLVQERKPARSYFLKMLCLFSTKLWLSGNSCDGQPLQRADEESVIPLFQVQPDVGPPLLCCWAPEAEGKESFTGQIQKQPAALRRETCAFLRCHFNEKGCRNFVS